MVALKNLRTINAQNLKTALSAMNARPGLLELRNVTSAPPKDRRMRDFDAALGHHLHKISIRQPISDVPAHAQLDDVGVEYAFTVHRVTRDRLRHSAPRANKIRQSIRCPRMHQNRPDLSTSSRQTIQGHTTARCFWCSRSSSRSSAVAG